MRSRLLQRPRRRATRLPRPRRQVYCQPGPEHGRPHDRHDGRRGPRGLSGETDELTAGARGGDDAAYEALFARVADRLLLYVRLRLGPRLAGTLEPMDVVQETYLAALRSFAGFEPRGPGAFSRWLFRIADNRLRDAVDHQDAHKRQALARAARSSSVLDRLRAEGASPATESDRREQVHALHEALARLAEDERQAVLLRHFHEATFAEIGAQLGTSEPTARRLVVRAYAHLGEALRGSAP